MGFYFTGAGKMRDIEERVSCSDGDYKKWIFDTGVEGIYCFFFLPWLLFFPHVFTVMGSGMELREVARVIGLR